ncbi:hypothetical protein JK163_10755 [Levilactobacillus brevis]|uniref:hypothetical protein n=1 Tax=Levilactobacillus brevis TaxID=1580 RepID=UPI001BA6C868|nr:hypothetical protein [Levilactobacillus brevis]MBS1006757.1 hypothetical protein [Levilactobacillus brevis]MBS1014066.1 hypothetical protein [Levilactobacillus brevis]
MTSKNERLCGPLVRGQTVASHYYGGGKVVNIGDSIYYLICFVVLFALTGGIVFGIYWVIRHFK